MNVTMRNPDGSQYITEAQDMPPRVGISSEWTGSCHPVALRQSVKRVENPAPIKPLFVIGVVAVVVVVVGISVVWK